mgnify:CR=1 FL=1
MKAISRPLLWAALSGLLIAGCRVETGPPSPTPADFPGIVRVMARQGIVVQDIVSGDAGCPDPALTRLAIAFSASGLDQTGPVRIHAYLFRDRAAFDRLRPSIDLCARIFVTDPATFGSIEAPPFVLAGQGPWAPGFAAALRASLTAAAESGG